jgi:hypothetical protein
MIVANVGVLDFNLIYENFVWPLVSRERIKTTQQAITRWPVMV